MIHRRLRLGMGTKTLAALSFVFWIPVGLLAFLLYHGFEQKIAAERLELLDIRLQGAQTLLEDHATRMQTALVVEAQDPEFLAGMKSGDSIPLVAGLDRIARSLEEPVVLAVTDSRRNLLAGDDPSLWIPATALTRAMDTGRPTRGHALLPAEMFQSILGGRHAQLPEGVPVLVQFVVQPVHEGGSPLGAMVAVAMLSGDTSLGNRFLGDFDRELGVFAGINGKPMRLHATTSVPRSIWGQSDPLPGVVRAALDQNRPFSGPVTLDGQKLLLAAVPLHDSRGNVIAALAVGERLQPLQGLVLDVLGQAIVLTALLALAIALLSVFFVHHDISRPLRRLLDGMRRFGEGELDTRVHLCTGDQLEQLGAGFNRMAEDVQKRETRFRKHNEVTKLFMSTLNMDELLGQTLEIVVGVTESQIGILYLWEEEGQVLMPHARFGVGSESNPVALGEGYVGQCAQSRRRLALSAAGEDGLPAVDTGFGQLALCQAVYLPLVSQDSLLGVLLLGSTSEYDRDSDQLFEYLSDQIAMALDNAFMHRQIAELSVTDGLTGLHNRRFLNTRIEPIWRQARASGQPLCVVLSDIDNFKSLNDTFGHDRGDIVLRDVAAIFQEEARPGDLVTRFGGEEFVIVLPMTDSAEAKAVSTRILERTRALRYDWLDRPVTLSIGVAASPPLEVDHFDALLQAADQAMYRGKMGGKDQVVIAGEHPGG